MKRFWLAAAFLLALPTLAPAQTKKGNIEWGVFLGREFYSHSITIPTTVDLTPVSSFIDDDFISGARLAYGLTDKFEIELIIDKSETNGNPDDLIDVSVDSLTANFVWNFWSSERDLVGLYGSGGIGTIDMEIGKGGSPVKDDDTLIALGIGVRTFLGRRIAFRYEFRAKDYTVFDEGVTDLEVTFGLAVFHRRK